MAEIKMIPLKQLKPNPFRDLERYPIDERKIDELIDSYKISGFWGNVYCRPAGKFYELAFGHHRFVALNRLYEPRQRVQMLVEHISDKDMMVMLDRENSERFGALVTTAMETIRSLLYGYAEGRIKLPPMAEKTKKEYIRWAPSTLHGEASPGIRDCPYTITQLCTFLGRPDKDRGVRVALTCLEAVELGVCEESEFSKWSRDTCNTIASEAIRTYSTLVSDNGNEKKAQEEAKEKAKKKAEAVKAEKERKKREKEKKVEITQEEKVVLDAEWLCRAFDDIAAQDTKLDDVFARFLNSKVPTSSWAQVSNSLDDAVARLRRYAEEMGGDEKEEDEAF